MLTSENYDTFHKAFADGFITQEEHKTLVRSYFNLPASVGAEGPSEPRQE